MFKSWPFQHPSTWKWSLDNSTPPGKRTNGYPPRNGQIVEARDNETNTRPIMLGIHVEFQWCKDFGQIGMKQQMHRSKRITVEVPTVVDLMMHVRMLVHMTDILAPKKQTRWILPRNSCCHFEA